MYAIHRFRIAFPAFALAVVASAATAQEPARQAPELAGLDAYIETAMDDWEVPALAIAVIDRGEVVFAEGYGERTVGGGEPVDENTLFAIASTTKAMTVAAVGMLVDEGLLDWDDRVTEHLPAFELEDPYVTRYLTIRDLLTHRTGVSRSDNVWIAGPFDRDEVVRRAKFLSQTRGFRARYGYNNIMYMVAGEVVEAVSGMPWPDFIESRLFGPLGIERSTPRAAVVATRENVAGSHTRSEGEVIAVPHRDYDALGPAGSVFSSVSDMARWIRLHLGHGEFGGTRLLDSATVAEMHSPQTVIPVDSVDRRLFPSTHFRAYGLGWRMQNYHGRKIVQHTGSVNYMRTQVGMIPEEGIGFVAFTNLSSSELQSALMYRVFDALLGIPATDWSAEYLALDRRGRERAEEREAEREAERVEGTEPSLTLDAYAGVYADSLYGEMDVALEDDALVLRYTPDYTADLSHWHYDTFRADWRRPGYGHSLVHFTLDARARVRTLEVPGFTAFERVREEEP